MLPSQSTFLGQDEEKHAHHYLSRLFHLHPFVMQHLMKKGVSSEQDIFEFLYPRLQHLHNPFLMDEMSETVRIIQAELSKSSHSFYIFGDYDVDGITSTTILVKTLRAFGGNVQYRLPIREEGYGLSIRAVDEAMKAGTTCLITVDNGSSCHEAVSYAVSHGLTVIVTDHHEVLFGRPNAHAFINPKRKDNSYPFPELSGAGVALKVAQALLSTTERIDSQAFFLDLIELATLGTIADMMILTDENRTITSIGLRKLSACPSDAMRDLKAACYVNQVTSSDVGFSIAPVLNASGRVGDPNLSVRFLLDPSLGKTILPTLVSWNRERKERTKNGTELADHLVKQQTDSSVLCLYGAFPNGLQGIIASRLLRTYQKPVIVISQNGKASCRGLKEYSHDMMQILESCAHLFTHYGGHELAAGFTISPEKIPLLQTEIEKLGAYLETPIAQSAHDFVIPIHRFPRDLFYDLSFLEPFGRGNEKPLFLSRATPVSSISIFGNGDKHAKYMIEDREAIQFFCGNGVSESDASRPHDLLYSVSTNRYGHYFLEHVQKK